MGVHVLRLVVRGSEYGPRVLLATTCYEMYPIGWATGRQVSHRTRIDERRSDVLLSSDAILVTPAGLAPPFPPYLPSPPSLCRPKLRLKAVAYCAGVSPLLQGGVRVRTHDAQVFSGSSHFLARIHSTTPLASTSPHLFSKLAGTTDLSVGSYDQHTRTNRITTCIVLHEKNRTGSISSFRARCASHTNLCKKLSCKPGISRKFGTCEACFRLIHRWNEMSGQTGDARENPPTSGIVRHKYEFIVEPKLNTISAYTRQKAKSKYRNLIQFQRAPQKQSINTHKSPYDRVKQCRELVPHDTTKIKIIANTKCLVGRQNFPGLHQIYLAFHWLFSFTGRVVLVGAVRLRHQSVGNSEPREASANSLDGPGGTEPAPGPQLCVAGSSHDPQPLIRP
ncbi:hypothetical protein PR048_010262 [Dryococelus australis]|uniref:Uncharacterized protein n=1 Tax=Dryococelus australis TaxID=614101 RepID=A0ABQ9I489_9NEOP|nr:hypothetical protein PR048_010262 [Dryococelus australis]